MIYLILILFSFLITLLVSLYLTKNPVALSIPTERGLHEITTPTSGGLALFAGFMLGAIIMEFVNYGFYSIQTLIIFSAIQGPCPTFYQTYEMAVYQEVYNSKIDLE